MGSLEVNSEAERSGTSISHLEEILRKLRMGQTRVVMSFASFLSSGSFINTVYLDRHKAYCCGSYSRSWRIRFSTTSSRRCYDHRVRVDQTCLRANKV